MATPQKKMSAFAEIDIDETGYIWGNEDAGGPTGRIPVDDLRSRLNTANQIITGDITHTGDSVQTGDSEVVGSHKATSYEGNGSLITGVTAAGTGGTSSTSSLSLVCNSANGTPLAKIVASKYSTDIFKADETGFEVQTGIPYSHADASIPFNKDLDLQNKYLLRSQTIQNLKPFQYLHFDGVNDSASISDDSELDVGTNDYSIIFDFRTTDSGAVIMHKLAASVGYSIGLSSGKLFFLENAGASQIDSDAVVNGGVWHRAVISCTRGGEGFMSVDCKKQADTITSVAATMSNASDLYLGYDGSSNYYEGELTEPIILNRALSDDEALIYGSPLTPLPWTDEGGSNVAQNVSNFVNSSYDTFSGASATGFTAVKTTSSGNQFCGTATEISVEKGKCYRLKFTETLNSGVVPKVQIVDSIGGSNWTVGFGQATSNGANELKLVVNTTGVGAIQFYNLDGELSNYVVSDFSVSQVGETFHLRSQDIVSDENGNGVIWLDSVHDNNAAISGAVVGNKSKTQSAERGSFTATLTTGTSGTITLDSTRDTLFYSKNNGMFYFGGQITVLSVSSPVGELILNGFPVDLASLPESAGTISVNLKSIGLLAIAASGGIAGVVQSGAVIYIRDGEGTTGGVNLDFAEHIQAGSSFYVSGFFPTND